MITSRGLERFSVQTPVTVLPMRVEWSSDCVDRALACWRLLKSRPIEQQCFYRGPKTCTYHVRGKRTTEPTRGKICVPKYSKGANVLSSAYTCFRVEWGVLSNSLGQLRSAERLSIFPCGRDRNRKMDICLVARPCSFDTITFCSSITCEDKKCHWNYSRIWNYYPLHSPYFCFYISYFWVISNKTGQFFLKCKSL